MLWKREGPGTPAPRDGLRGYWYLLRTYFWRMLSLGLVFALCCLPVVTIPMALTAMDRVYLKLIRTRNCLFWEEFRDEFKGSWWKSLRAGVLFALLLAVSYYLLSLSVSNGGSLFGIAFGVAGLLLAFLTVPYGCYAFLLIAAQDLPLRQILRNARALVVLCIGPSAAVTVLVFAFFAVFFLHPLIFLFLFLAGGFAVVQFTVCSIANGPLSRYVLKEEERP